MFQDPVLSSRSDPLKRIIYRFVLINLGSSQVPTRSPECNKVEIGGNLEKYKLEN
jgi:hypothetical protein